MEIVENGYHEQYSSRMHYCKVCNRGFTCGEALGGHMRAHGLVDTHNYEESTTLGNFEDKLLPAADANNKHSYFLRTTSNRFLSCKAREASCDKMSLSTWRSDDHNENGKCSINEMAISVPIPWQMQSELENDESCASSQEEEELANCLVLLSSNPLVFSSKEEDHKPADVKLGNFQCKGCKKVFNSHQALGGHRASHKNVKGCFASSFDHHNLTDDQYDEKSDQEGTMNMNNNELLSNSSRNSYDQFSGVAARDSKDGPVLEAARRAPWNFHTKKKARVHECSICYRVFSSGQALGGHKRCHWLSSNLPAERQQHDDVVEQKLVFKKPIMDQKCSEGTDHVDLNFSLMSNNLAHDHDHVEAVPIRAYLPTMQKEDGEAMADFSHEEEGRSKKLEKLSDLRDVDLDGGSSTWLQMGITSTT